jgi:hypothetical protein
VSGAPSEALRAALCATVRKLKSWRAEWPAIRPFCPASEGAPAGGASQRMEIVTPPSTQISDIAFPDINFPLDLLVTLLAPVTHSSTTDRQQDLLCHYLNPVYRHADAMAAPQVTNKTSGGNAAFHNFNNDFAHISDPNERRRLALAEIDKAPFGWYHVRACVVAGIGFFTDSYDVSSPHIHTQMRLTRPRSSPLTW